ncbi:hypothetical protein OSB04_005591 [Centaurea solstitialis]|uniref:Uncharacterized protein n=1 Tax=Centaurea solstitialis TaxID=347529 RepID=A0AA38TU87_9ASTR|nr:hypothetical protein OSB04_005591 [Centaurea solstitialis]
MSSSSSSRSSSASSSSIYHPDYDYDADDLLEANHLAAIAAVNEAVKLIVGDEATSSRQTRRTPKSRNRIVAHEKLVNDYFSDNPVWTHDARGVKGFSPLQKCTSAIRQLAYGTAADATDEYLQMSETTSRECFTNFCEGIIHLYMRRYLRKPTANDVQLLFALHEQQHGLPGMLGSIDCMHWDWKNCPVAWRGQYHRGKAPDSSFTVNGRQYKHGYYLADGIYPKWTTFVKAYRYPTEPERIAFTERQESARKDIERAFAMLKSKWHIVKYPARAWTKKKLRYTMYTCIILHNMIREDEGFANYPFDESWVSEDEVDISEEERAQNVNEVSSVMKWMKWVSFGSSFVQNRIVGLDGRVENWVCKGRIQMVDGGHFNSGHHDLTVVNHKAVAYWLRPVRKWLVTLYPEDACNDVKCGKGVCKPSNNSAIPYECECSPGWKQLSTDDDDDDNDDHHLKFLPCVIPNCTLDYSCSKAAPPVQEKENRGNESIFDGSLGLDCKNLNIGFANKSTPSPPPSSSADRSNQANFGVEGRFNWLIFTLAMLAS